MKTKAPKGNFSKLVPLLHAISAKDMGIWLSIAHLVKIAIIDGAHIEAPQSNSEEFTY